MLKDALKEALMKRKSGLGAAQFDSDPADGKLKDLAPEVDDNEENEEELEADGGAQEVAASGGDVSMDKPLTMRDLMTLLGRDVPLNNQEVDSMAKDESKPKSLQDYAARGIAQKMKNA